MVDLLGTNERGGQRAGATGQAEAASGSDSSDSEDDGDRSGEGQAKDLRPQEGPWKEV